MKNRNCSIKVTFCSPMEADRAASKYKNRGGKPKHRNYWCSLHQGWHLATITRFKKKKKKKA